MVEQVLQTWHHWVTFKQEFSTWLYETSSCEEVTEVVWLWNMISLFN